MANSPLKQLTIEQWQHDMMAWTQSLTDIAHGARDLHREHWFPADELSNPPNDVMAHKKAGWWKAIPTGHVQLCVF